MTDESSTDAAPAEPVADTNTETETKTNPTPDPLPDTDTDVEDVVSEVPNPFYMAGTEGTGNYVVLYLKGATRVTRLGIRCLGSGYRVRLEPGGAFATLEKHLTRDAGWKQPGDDGQHRFSKVCNTEDLEAVLAQVFAALGVTVNPLLVQHAMELAYNKAWAIA